MTESIGYLGPAGTYTEQAALLYAPEANLKPYPTINAVGTAVPTANWMPAWCPSKTALKGR